MEAVRDRRIGYAPIYDYTVPLVGAQVASTGATVVSISDIGDSGTPGAWTELFAATTADAHWLSLAWSTTGTTTVAAAVLADIAIGAAAAEVAIISSMAAGGVLATTGFTKALLPIFVPTGSRLSMRLSAAGVHPETSLVMAQLFGASPLTPHRRSPRQLVAIGANVAGLTGDCQISSNNTYVQITAATTQPFQGLVMSHCGNDAATLAADQTITLGVGASGGEVTLAEDSHLTGSTEQYTPRLGFPTIFRHIPTGVRLAAKSTAGTSNTWTVIPLGIPYA